MSHRTSFGLLLTVVMLVLTAGTVFAQSGSTKQVGLVVTFPDGVTHTEIVTVPTTATALDVLNAGKLSVVSAESSFGPALCKINTTGCSADNCFCDEKNYWAYYHLSGSTWAGAEEGIGVYVPANGSVEGFAWSGFDADFRPTVQPPVYTFDQLLANQAPRVPTLALVALVLVGIGLVGLIWYMQRRRRQTA